MGHTAFFADLPQALSELVQQHEPESPEHQALVCSVIEELRASPIGTAIRRVRGHDDDAATVLMLLVPDAMFEGVPGMADLRALGSLPATIALQTRSHFRETVSTIGGGAPDSVVLALKVDDLDGTVAVLRGRGASFVTGPTAQ